MVLRTDFAAEVLIAGRKLTKCFADKALVTMKDRVRCITVRHGRSLKAIVAELRRYLLGWKNYFRLAQSACTFHDLDKWIRHRLRAIQLKHWRHCSTIYGHLRRRGIAPNQAWTVARNTGRWWRNSAMTLNRALPVRHFDTLGLPRLVI